MGLKRSIHEAPMARLAHGEHRKVHMRSEHQHRWHPSAKGRRQGLVPSLWYHYGPPPLNDSYELAVGQALTEFACIGMLMVVPHPRQEE
jgi:hypothetical protein